MTDPCLTYSQKSRLINSLRDHLQTSFLILSKLSDLINFCFPFRLMLEAKLGDNP